MTGALLLALGLLTGCGGSSTPKVTLSGGLTLHSFDSATTSDNTVKVGTTCSGTGGYGDLVPGAQVLVVDGNGKTLGTGNLTAGKVTNDQELSGGGVTVSLYDCVWSFTLPGLPSTPFYRVSVTHRGSITYTLAQVKAGRVQLSLGSS